MSSRSVSQPGPQPERSVSVPAATMDCGSPASEFPPVLVMFHPSMKPLAETLVETVNGQNKVLDNGKVLAADSPRII